MRLLTFLCDVCMIYESVLNDKLIIDLFNIICTYQIWYLYYERFYFHGASETHLCDVHYRISPGYVSI